MGLGDDFVAFDTLCKEYSSRLEEIFDSLPSGVIGFIDGENFAESRKTHLIHNARIIECSCSSSERSVKIVLYGNAGMFALTYSEAEFTNRDFSILSEKGESIDLHEIWRPQGSPKFVHSFIVRGRGIASIHFREMDFDWIGKPQFLLDTASEPDE